MEKITVKINRFYDLIRNYNEGAPNTRYKSWEWCHQAFLEKKESYKIMSDSDKDQVVDYLSLHLAFYLASWGMYRGSSFLLQRDYKTHKEAVKCILNEKYDLLWNYDPTDKNIGMAKDLIFEENNGIYWEIRNSYKNIEENADIPTDTLITKILMGTFGCVPAFDRYLKKGISTIKNYCEGGVIGEYELTQSIEDVNGKTFMALSKLVVDRKSEFKIDSNIYPPMKCVDMYLWEIGYELDLADRLVNKEVSDEKKQRLLEVVKSLKLCGETVVSFEEASYQIKEKNS